MVGKINKPAFFVLVIYPTLLICLAIFYLSQYSFGLVEVLSLVLGYYFANISVGVGLHRLWAHDSYKTNKYVEFVLAILSAGTLQGPALSWASNHFKHHTYTDTEQDPHTPLKYESKFMGFWWSHMGWMLMGEGSYKSVDKITMVKLGRNKVLRWQLRYYWQIALIMNTLVPALFGYMLGGNLVSALAGYLFIGLGRALQQQVTFFVNSLCHFVGTQKYTDGTSRDIWWLALLLLGENWHNFHHAFPTDYRNGARWYQADVHKWIIFAMSKLGLAWDLKRTADVRVEAKMSKTMESFIKARQEQYKFLQKRLSEISTDIKVWRSEIENSPNEIKNRLTTSFQEMQKNINNIAKQLKAYENPSEKFIKAVSKKLHETELAAQKLYNEFQNLKSYV